MSELNYTPPSTVREFILNRSTIRAIMGPVGSAKTTGCIFALVFEGLRQPIGSDGKRRTRYAIVRNTNQQLMDTTYKSFTAFFKDGEAGTWRATDKTFVLKPNAETEIEFMFRPLDTEDDVQRLLSLEVSGIWFNEAREINYQVFLAAMGRIGRYPSKLQGGCQHPCLIMDTNAPEEDSWLYDLIEKDTPANMSFFRQPPALIPGTLKINPAAENLENLPDNYYETQLQSARGSDEYINVYLRNMYGRTNSGRPVFPVFNRGLHVAKSELLPNPLLPLYIGFDPGMNSGLVLGQYSLRGQLLIYDAIFNMDKGAERVVAESLKPLLASKFPQFETIICPDPAAAVRSSINEVTIVDRLQRMGFNVQFPRDKDGRPDRNNRLQPRLEAVEYFLSRMVEGGAALCICPVGATTLIRALEGGYRYPVSKTSADKIVPEKNQHSHVADAFQYLCRYIQRIEVRASRNKHSSFKPRRRTNPYAVP